MYFKILRNDLTHNGFVYHEGLNEDTLPFDKTPDCGGGLFFSDEKNIVGFCGYGDKIAIVELPENEEVVQVDTKYKAHRIILSEIRDLWTIETFEWLLKNGVDIHANKDDILCWASENNHVRIVQWLLKNSADIHAYDDAALRYASGNGHTETVKLLLENGANICKCDDFLGWDALIYASFANKTEVVRLLLEKGKNTNIKKNKALYKAAEVGHIEVVRLLLENGAKIKGFPRLRLLIHLRKNKDMEMIRLLKRYN